MNKSAILKCFSVVFLFCIGFKSYSQDLNVNLKKLNGSADTNDYSLEVFNNFSKPIAIKVSMDFIKLSNLDTLAVAIGEWSNTNGNDYYYGIEYSVRDRKGSEPGLYHLFILNPQSYLLTNVKLTDFSKYRDKTLWFSLTYLDILSNKDSVHLDGANIHLARKFDRPFKTRNIKIN